MVRIRTSRVEGEAVEASAEGAGPGLEGGGGRLTSGHGEQREILGRDPSHAQTLASLGQRLERAGRRREALAVYERFLEVWKGADRGIPLLGHVRSRVATLRAAGGT